MSSFLNSHSAEDFILNDTWLHIKNKLYYKCPWPVFLHKNMQNNENFCALSFGFSAFSNEFWIFEHMSSFDIIAESNLFFRSFSGPICNIPHNFHLNHCGSRIEKKNVNTLINVVKKIVSASNGTLKKYRKLFSWNGTNCKFVNN